MSTMRVPTSCDTIARGLLLGLAVLHLSPSARADAADLRARYESQRAELKPDAYGNALHIDSIEERDRLTGDVYAVLEHPFGKVGSSLKDPAHWCDLLILPFNTKYCHVVGTEAAPALLLRIGRKADQPLSQAFKLQLAWRSVAAGSDYFETTLHATDGPMGTRNYRIALAAMPVEGNRTFMRLTYSYGFNFASRLAMQTYLGTVGADKTGFTVVRRDAQGRPQYIGGVRGATERNAMRYYLAIDAYLDSLAAPPGQQTERRIQSWFTATEHYAAQLHEMERAQYVTMKREEVARQRTLVD